MAIKDSLLPEFDHEMSNTRRVLERVPGDKLEWRPHPKSGTFAWLAGHLANLPTWTGFTLDRDAFDMAAPGPRPDPITSRDQLLATFDQNVAAARAALSQATDEQMIQLWSLKQGDQTFFTMPKVAVLRSFVMNHSIHHRGELIVYLRLNDIPVPGVYGPSADENTM
jgi:uncharacterized damage-inducible protein DinB